MNGYSIFLTIQLAIALELIDSELPYDVQWSEGEELHSKYDSSIFNDSYTSEYDCIVSFLKNEKEILDMEKIKLG